jgi:hypothetical protein
MLMMADGGGGGEDRTQAKKRENQIRDQNIPETHKL